MARALTQFRHEQFMNHSKPSSKIAPSSVASPIFFCILTYTTYFIQRSIVIHTKKSKQLESFWGSPRGLGNKGRQPVWNWQQGNKDTKKPRTTVLEIKETNQSDCKGKWLLFKKHLIASLSSSCFYVANGFLLTSGKDFWRLLNWTLNYVRLCGTFAF